MCHWYFESSPMAHSTDQKTTHFGFETVNTEDKADKVAEVFRSVAPRYDLMNDLMSAGLHRYWKHYTVDQARLQAGMVVIDVASGTGDLAKAFARKVGPLGKVILTDINEAMLTVGRERLTDAGIIGNVEYVLANAETLPFPDNHADRITIAFGLRNVTDKFAALSSMFRCLKPGGKVMVLEFSHPTSALLSKAYDVYSFNVIPKLGELITKDKASYQYLVESIRMHPKQDELKTLMEAAGFEDVTYTNLTGGIVALHQGWKY
jgi:demethylmenaquinone methyltransferase/2-methoxy-6-polyprenyl-1,4-benzoquinol methylase